MKPQKHLGQNFLTNVNAARRIASLLELTPADQVLEIGGGRGDLTTHLLETGAQVKVVEIDKVLSAALRIRFRESENLVVIGKSILEFDPTTFFTTTDVKLVGNIPYNLTSEILEWLIDRRELFSRVVLMLQKEVATRVTAKPGNKDFGSLTVFVQLFYDADKVFDLRPGSFYPPPRVHSSVIKLNRREQPPITKEDFPILRRLTAACFRWRRKQIARILREEYGMEPKAITMLLASQAIKEAARPEQLKIDDFVTLAKSLAWAGPATY